ncbi:MAG: hypothetical protein JNM89_14325 [Hyphomicrobiaceae bacterium]|nr:hypothetical protein [Hyphomicrobiaceae bacterium]
MHSSWETHVAQRGAGFEDRRREAAATAVLVAAVCAVLMGGLMAAARSAGPENDGRQMHDAPALAHTLGHGL